jgi:hypothetical protein
MRTLAEIEEQSDAVKKRMAEIFLDMQKGFVGREHRASELAEELALLLHESKSIQVSLAYFRETAQQLLEAPAHGPH